MLRIGLRYDLIWREREREQITGRGRPRIANHGDRPGREIGKVLGDVGWDLSNLSTMHIRWEFLSFFNNIFMNIAKEMRSLTQEIYSIFDTLLYLIIRRERKKRERLNRNRKSIIVIILQTSE